MLSCTILSTIDTLQGITVAIYHRVDMDALSFTGEQPDLARALSGVLRVQDVAASAQQLLHQKQRDLL